MISILTPDGSKNLIFRGIMTEDGLKAIAAGSITAPGPVDREFWDGSLSALSVSIDPTYALGGAASPVNVTIPTASVLASVSNGAPPVTIEWEEDVVDAPGWSISSPSTAGTNFYCVDVAPAQVRTASFKVTATDARGATGEAIVGVQVENYGSI